MRTSSRPSCYLYAAIDREIAFRPAPGAPGPVPTAVPIEDLGGNELPEPIGEEEARTFFPESWIFQLLKAEYVPCLSSHNIVVILINVHVHVCLQMHTVIYFITHTVPMEMLC